MRIIPDYWQCPDYFNLSLMHRREAIERVFSNRMPLVRESIEYQLLEVAMEQGLPGLPLPEMIDECFERILYLSRPLENY